MAYREFRNESLYDPAAPPPPTDMSFVQQALANMARERSLRQKAAEDEKQRRAEAAEKFKVDDLKAARYTHTQSQIGEGSRQVVAQAQRDILETGTLRTETRQQAERLRETAAQSEINWNRARELENNVNQVAAQKPHYRADEAFRRIKQSEYGGDGAFDESVRNENLNKVVLDMGDDPENLLNTPVAVDSWMKTIEEKERQSATERGDTTTRSSVASRFGYDPKTRRPVITAEDVEGYFAFEPAARKLYTDRAMEKKRADARRHVAEQKARGVRLDEEAVFQEFIERPESDPYDKSRVGAWIYKLAADDIARQAGLKTNFEVQRDEPRESEVNRSQTAAQLQPELTVSRSGAKTQNRGVVTNEFTGYTIKGVKGNAVVPYQDITVTPKNVFALDGSGAAYGNATTVTVRATNLSYGLATPAGNPLLGTQAQRLQTIRQIRSKDQLRTIVPTLLIEGTVADKSAVDNDAPGNELGGGDAGGGTLLSAGTQARSRTTQRNRRVAIIPDLQTFNSLNAGAKGGVDYAALPKPQEAADIEAAMAEQARKLHGREMSFRRLNRADFNTAVSQAMQGRTGISRKDVEKAILEGQEQQGVILQIVDF